MIDRSTCFSDVAMTLEPLTLSCDDAQALLRRFTCLDRLPAETSENHAPKNALSENELVRQALLLVRDHSDYQIFGICADGEEQAIAALHTYLNALGYPELPKPTVAIAGPVYLKFNPKTGLCHLDSYTGSHRGVLVSCQSAYDGDVNEVFGHLPLDLFE